MPEELKRRRAAILSGQFRDGTRTRERGAEAGLGSARRQSMTHCRRQAAVMNPDRSGAKPEAVEFVKNAKDTARICDHQPAAAIRRGRWLPGEADFRGRKMPSRASVREFREGAHPRQNAGTRHCEPRG